MAKRQCTLLETWHEPSKKSREESASDTDIQPEENETEEPSSSVVSDHESDFEPDESRSSASGGSSECKALCCRKITQSFQPKDKQILLTLSYKKRNFQSKWYVTYPWLTVCITTKKVLCLYCRYANQHSLITFSKMGENAFTETGFRNWRKAVEKFKCHESSHVHREAQIKWAARGQATIESRLQSQLAQSQLTRRQGLLAQIRAIVFLTRQGIALRGHTEKEGNLSQLLQALSRDNAVIQAWIRNNRFTSHQAVNEMINSLGLTLLRTLLKKVTSVTGPSWFSVIADEATDVINSEQLNLSIRWVADDYDIHEDPLGLYRVPDTKAETLFSIIKDLLIRCNLPLALCRGQAYDGAANMQGRRSGVAARFLQEQPAAIPVHCCAHSLNLCLQDAGRKLTCLRDALELCREIINLIRFSPKRLHLFSSNLQASGSGTTLKPLCPTRWTARTAAIDAILKDYVLLMETLEEVHLTTYDEYGLKAGGYLQSMEKFSTLFGFRLAHTVFSAAEQVSYTLQKKAITIRDALSAVDAAKAYFKRIRSHKEFDLFFDATIRIAEQHCIGKPELPRNRRRPARYQEGSESHQFPTARDYYRHIYFEACDLLSGELESRFKSQHMPPVLAMEQALLKAANGKDFSGEINTLKDSCYKNDVEWSAVSRHLPLLKDVVAKAAPDVKIVTSIETVCDAINSNHIYKEMLSSVHLLLRLYMTIPITSATSERSFSALRRLLTYLRSSMSEQRLNNCLLLHVHKEITDSLDHTLIAKEFIEANDERKKYFGSFQ